MEASDVFLVELERQQQALLNDDAKKDDADFIWNRRDEMPKALEPNQQKPSIRERPESTGPDPKLTIQLRTIWY